jgi:hypothetical protein
MWFKILTMVCFFLALLYALSLDPKEGQFGEFVVAFIGLEFWLIVFSTIFVLIGKLIDWLVKNT